MAKTAKNRVRANGDLIKRLRSEKVLTQADLAEAADCDVRTIRRAEHGESILSSTLQAIAKALGVKPSAILLGAGPIKVSQVNFIQHFDEEPGPYFKSPAILERLAEFSGRVEVLGRTCRSWLVSGNEKSERVLQDLIVEAARKGSELCFVVQKATVSVPFFSKDDMALLQEHLRASVESYRQIQDRLRTEGIPGERVKLFFTDQPLLQSMTRIQIRDDKWLVLSVRTDFKPQERKGIPHVKAGPQGLKWDPQIIFKADARQADEYNLKFDAILEGSDKQGGLGIKAPVQYSRYRVELLI